MSMGGSRGIVPSGESALLMCHRFPSKAPQNNDDKFRGQGCLKNWLHGHAHHYQIVRNSNDYFVTGFSSSKLVIIVLGGTCDTLAMHFHQMVRCHAR